MGNYSFNGTSSTMAANERRMTSNDKLCFSLTCNLNNEWSKIIEGTMGGDSIMQSKEAERRKS